MKRKLTFLLTALLLLTGLSSWGQSRTQINWVASAQGYSNGEVIESVEFDSHVLGSFNKGTNSNAPKYYNTGSAVRCYGGNYFTITVDEGSLTEIVLTFASGEGTNAITTDVGTYSNGTWTGSTSEVTFTIGGSSGHRRISQFDITYSGGGGQQTVATPTFDPEGGTYFESQQVSINCTTEGATIRYTLDGSTPDESSTQYSAPLTIAETTTVKAKAFKSGYTASNVATATYNIPTLKTIAEARALSTNDYALVRGVVTFIDNRNIYIQDDTGGIDLFLNNGTVPSTLALGDMVQACGKFALYNGLVELSGINGNNTEEFSILSSGNTLPVAVKTISEVLAGAEATGTLQATRVKIEGAVIGAINTSGNTTLTQGDDVINIYKVPELPNISEGQTVDVTAIVGYFNAPQLRVALASDVELYVIADPQLNISTTSLNGFQYTYGSGPSAEKTFLVSGSDLTNDVVLTAPQNYELSHSPSNGFFNSETLSPVNGTLAETTIYVRMKAGLQAGNYNGNLTITCGNLSEAIALTGTVSEQPVAAAPTFSPNGGSYITAQTVSMNCETQGASIYYTTNGSTPTENSTLYSQPITVSTTTTIKAIAVAEGYQNSTVATATYTISEVVSIASARALANNEYACVEGTVTFMDGRNVYIQDATAGIDLYLNSNTVPTSLAIGDNVRAYGKKTTFNGLVELTGIAGNNADVFSIISSGNTLPLATKTIAEINSDFGGNNLLQATRVMVENAVIGTINPSGTTVISQEGNNLNVYHIPTVEGMVQGDWVTITGIVGCYNAPQLLVASANDIQFTHRPSIVPTPASLSGLDYEYEQGGPSEIVYFTLSGQNLFGNVDVYPSENFEVSTMGGNYFSPENPASIHSQGHFSGIKVFVRLKAGLEEGTYAEQLSIVSQDADTVHVAVTGTVIGTEPPTPPTPPTPSGEYVRINDLSQLTEGSLVVFAARFDGNATSYYAMSNQASGKPTGVLFTSTTSGSDEILPASIVDEENSYYWTVGVTSNGYTFTNAAGEMIGYTSSTNFATGGDNTEWTIAIQTSEGGAMVPNYTGFVVGNVNNTVRAFALNSSHNFGPYHTQNIAGSNYNFFLDIFVKSEGGEPPVPPTPTVATPSFTPASGTYSEAQQVAISCTTEGATIYYSMVSENGPWTEYTAAITVDESMTIWAYAEKEGYNNSPVAEATYTIQMGFVTIFNQDWESEMNGWTFVNVEGEMNWTVATYQGNHYAYANGYSNGAAHANEDWCISPAFNLNAISNPVLSFRTAKNYTGNDLEVFFSNDYDGEDPTNATWQPLTCALSQGSWNWVESGDISLSNFSGSECYIGFKYTSTDESAAGWEVDDILLIGQTSEPVVTVTPLALTGFTYMEGNGPSATQTFTISGLNLSSNITITPPAHYEISETSGSGYTQSPIVLNPVGGNIEETVIYVRLIAGLTIGEYNNEIIAVASDDIDDIQVTCNGTVTEQPVPGDDYVRISDVSELADGNHVIIAARFDENVSDYYAMSNTASGKPTGVLFTSIISDGVEILPPSIFGEEDSYYWTVNITADGYTFTNAAGDMIGYASGTNFSPNGDNTAWSIEIGTSEATAMVPNYTGFVISNVNTPIRAFALNNNHNFGPYHTQNIAGEGYNFFMDIFMQGEGGVPPTPTVAAPTFTPAAGTYYEVQEVTISCTTADATIYYSTESENGPWDEYEDPILVDESKTLWAYATKEGYNDSPVVSAEYVIQAGLEIIFNQDWEDDWNGWTEALETGDSLWRIASYQGNHYAYANGYNHPATIDWLISPAFDLDSYSGVVLTFVTAKNYTGPDIEVLFSNDYDGQDPTIATWQPLECELSQGGWNWVESGEISLDEFSGSNCYIGFKYTCTDDEAAGWEVDDIMLVSGGGAIPTPTLVATPNSLNGFSYVEGNGPSASQSYTLTGSDLEGEGNITVTANEYFEISLDDEEFFATREIAYADGQLVNQPVTIYVRLVEGLEIGSYEGAIVHEGGNAAAEVNVAGTVRSENEPAMSALMPYYIQGNNGSNNNRVPMAASVQFANLEPNTTYRYTNQFVDENDGPETAGAGNVIYADPEGFYRSTSPSLGSEDGYGEFTTDEDGHAMVWLMNEPTANARFTPGNHVYMRVRLNDGNDGTTVAQVFTSEDYATVLNFGTENDEYSGSAFYVKSNEAPMSFAMMFATYDDLRPVYSTSIEATGVDYGSINQYADFYKEKVAGNDGWFGGIMPNDNENGINIIWILDMQNNLISDYYTMDGEWNPEANTVNPTNGLDEPIFIDLTDDGVDDTVETNVKVWSADHSFVIENGDDCHYTMSVVSMLGQTLIREEIAAGSTLRVSHHLVPGIYIVSLQNSQNKVAVKVMVK